MSCGTNTSPICPCGTVVHPAVVFNPPSLDVIAYRAGDYTAFRHALLQALEGEHELTQRIDDGVRQIWRPSVTRDLILQTSDLALQMMEWWAYLADVLTFYNERVANQAYLRTADLPESVNRLIQILGYRPRPALGATGVIAALVSSSKPVTLPQGFQIQSKAGPGQQPQIFELMAATTSGLPDKAPVSVPPPAAPVLNGATDSQGRPLASLLIAGTVGGLKVGDEVLLVEKGWAGKDGNWGIGVVQQFSAQKNPTGAINTSITVAITSAGSGLSGAKASSYRLLKSSGTATLFQYAAAAARAAVMHEGQLGPTGYTGYVVLASIFRQIIVGDPIVLEDPRPDSPNPPLAASVVNYAEVVYYANNPQDPSRPPPEPPSPPAAPPIPIPMPVSKITFATQGTLFGDPTTLVVRYGWRDLGTLIDPPVAKTGGTTSVDLTGLQISPADGFTAVPGNAVLVEDANGNGAAGSVDTPSSIRIPAPVPTLTAPLSVLFNLLKISRGKTVPNEVLGSGNAAILGQDFTLQKAPVTYVQDPASKSGDNYSSTVRVWVNGIEWQEVRSFYKRPANAQVFMTREDEQGKTHVVFGSRLPTGVNNIVASYRYGAGADAPSPGTLTVVLQPQPGLASIHNPVAPTGGADADPPDKVRKLAPRSVMTFNRAVSLDDYEVIAASAPGVRRAKAAFSFDATAQRPSVNIWVGDDAGAVAATQAALAATADPNRSVVVTQALQIETFVTLTYLRDPKYVDATVKGSLQAALLDPDKGLFGTNAVGIGQAFYDSQIYAACLAVPGVKAVHNLQFSPVFARARLQTFARRVIAAPVQLSSRAVSPASLPPLSPAAFAFRPLGIRGSPLSICRGHRYDPGPNGYFFVPDDDQHLTLSPGVAA
ncbi:MAG: baseplate J/gp47 family protein [Pseudomonadota bacterium]|nr:baseplate J/gp47 family protein [Pseudomonadota bacterium]